MVLSPLWNFFVWGLAWDDDFAWDEDILGDCAVQCISKTVPSIPLQAGTLPYRMECRRRCCWMSLANSNSKQARRCEVRPACQDNGIWCARLVPQAKDRLGGLAAWLCLFFHPRFDLTSHLAASHIRINPSAHASSSLSYVLACFQALCRIVFGSVYVPEYSVHCRLSATSLFPLVSLQSSYTGLVPIP